MQKAILLLLKVVLFIPLPLFLTSPIELNAQVFSEDAYKIVKVLDIINTNYVDSINENKVVEKAIIELLKQLDPHSTYTSAADVRKVKEPLEGSSEGVGVTYSILNDTVLVISPLSGGPSEKVGIRAGDRIIEIEGEKIAGIGITTEQMQKKLLGKKGSSINLSIQRRGVDNKLYFTVIRDRIPINSLDAAYMVNNDVGYIRLNRFSMNTMDEFRTALTRLKKQGIRNLILDLQDNGGGYMTPAKELADEFLDDKKLIVYTKGFNTPNEESFSSSIGEFEKGRLAILIDEGTASASEILAGAIQDWDRGIIVGRRSFGKGLVQREYSLSDGAMIRLTIARYYTPAGRSVQKPYNKGNKEYKEDITNRYNRGEMVNRDSIILPDSLKCKTLVNKRTIYGGGGIMPDVFVPMDTAQMSDFYTELLKKSYLYDFALMYMDNNRKILNETYPDFQMFFDKFVVSDSLLNGLFEYALKQEKKKSKKEIPEKKLAKYVHDFNKCKPIIKTVTKAYIARSLWTTSEYFQVLNSTDPTFKKAVEIIGSKSQYKDLLK